MHEDLSAPRLQACLVNIAKMNWPLLGVFLLALVLGPCHANRKYNVSFAELHKCKQYNAISGYNYRAFFKIHALDNHRLSNETDTIIDLFLYVMGSRDGHILLTQEAKVTAVALEIVLGGGANAFSQIRSGQKGLAVKTKSTVSLLSPIDPLPVRVNVGANGQIKVYAGNLSSEPLMETLISNMNVTSLKYVSFTTWSTAIAAWFYDCPDPSSTTNITNGTIVEGNELELLIDDKDRLKQNFLNASPQLDPPENFTGVVVSQLYVAGFSYDQTTSLIELSGTMRMSWKDPRYSWNASDYNGTHVLGDVCNAIWVPSFDPTSLFTGPFSFCIVLDDGTVLTVIEQFRWVNFCGILESYRWPYDSNTCQLRLAALGYERTVPLWLANQTVTYHAEFEQSQWTLKQLAKHEEHSETLYGIVPVLGLHIMMDRKSEIHSSSIYPTYFVANLLICISFLTEGRSRLLLNSLGLIVLLHSFLNLSTVVPPGGIPKIYIFFQWTLVFYVVSSVFFVIDLWLKRSRATLAPGSWLNRVISFPALRYALAMDQRSNYNTLEHKNVRWDEVTCVLNRIMLVVVVIFFSIGYTKP
ncbi:neuronal acetylcholine receptor subunit alpha-5-like [Anopheles ziemanni]|uniref:neuronal acetylcholine receptor subunit alpha-5-like n=1 Tax=Anopheles coustani TaxID=139045 RepID=UPI002659963E|nr:neuronal acetylcholine receptor subunit alpha-5-like [Anopheles coustani]XP_058170717.1 neuronal acetylcholine receptor subunit alpha-5-like [Anopheles ziemanni]